MQLAEPKGDQVQDTELIIEESDFGVLMLHGDTRHLKNYLAQIDGQWSANEQAVVFPNDNDKAWRVVQIMSMSAYFGYITTNTTDYPNSEEAVQGEQ